MERTVRETRWTDWLGLLAGLAALGLTLLFVLGLVVAVWSGLYRYIAPRRFELRLAVYDLSRPSLLWPFLWVSLPVLALAASSGAAGLALVGRGGPPVKRSSLPATAARYARVGLFGGVALSSLVVGAAAVLVFLRWCFWG